MSPRQKGRLEAQHRRASTPTIEDGHGLRYGLVVEVLVDGRVVAKSRYSTGDLSEIIGKPFAKSPVMLLLEQALDAFKRRVGA